jgi:polysaccharide deacetylase family protein (PEP-CTERM system associated)
MNVLTFDVEEWFHVLDHEPVKLPSSWEGRERRLELNMDRILEVLQRRRQPATFFCLGWVAERYPRVVRTLADLGYEIATHSYGHQLVYEQLPEDFEADLDRSINALSDLTGQEITAYRAPGFSLTRRSAWAVDALLQHGIKVDSSIFPGKRAHGGIPRFDCAAPCILQTGAGQLMEFPISTRSCFGLRIAFSGGGYFRATPYGVFKRLAKASDYTMSYLHPRDFDPEQPKVEDLPVLRRFKVSVGTRSALTRLDRMICDAEWVDLRTAVDSINWSQCQTIDFSAMARTPRSPFTPLRRVIPRSAGELETG